VARVSPRAAAASLAAALILGAAGCGGGPGGAEADVAAAVSNYIRASAAGNGEQACAYYTPELRTRIDRSARGRGLDGCAHLLGSALRYRLSQLPADVRKDVEEAIGDTDRVDVDMAEGGGTAEAALALPGEAQTETRVALVKRPEGWRIDRLGVKD